MYYKTEAFVMYSRDTGESDRIITLLSRDFGKIRVKVRGIRKIRNRYGMTFEPFQKGNIQIYSQAKGRFPILTGCDMHRDNSALRSDIGAFAFAMYFIEVIDNLTATGEKNPELYRLFSQTIYYLSEASKKEIVFWSAVLKFFKLSGWQIQWDTCMLCQKRAPFGNIYFSPAEGGVLCAGCNVNGIRISNSTWQYLKRLESMEWGLCISLRPPGYVQKEIEEVLEYYINEHIGADLKSKDFLEKMKRGIV